MHPAQKAIQAMHNEGRCPRLNIDVTHEQAVCPDFVVEKWQQRLVIDLDPSYPLELEFTEVGVEANLSFGGYVTRCVFPFAAIYVVADRETGRGQVLRENVPAALREQFNLPPALDASLTAVSDDDAKKRKGRRRRKRPVKKPALVVEAAPAEDETPTEGEAEGEGKGEGSTEAQTEAPAAAKDEGEQESVKTRRAAFQVIDGGG